MKSLKIKIIFDQYELKINKNKYVYLRFKPKQSY
jgi:hypothetical protein